MKLGSTVHLVYTGTLEDGTVFGTASEDQPMVFQTGMDLAIEGFEKEILEMSEVGEKRTFTVGMYEAYGEYLESMEGEVPRANVPVCNISVGQRIWMLDDNGEKFPATVKKLEEETVIFDLNHPLAGKDLNFEVEILMIEDAPEGFISAAEKQKLFKENNANMGFGEGGPETVML